MSGVWVGGGSAWNGCVDAEGRWGGGLNAEPGDRGEGESTGRGKEGR